MTASAQLLTGNGLPMKSDTVGMPLWEVAADLHKGKTVSVMMEPGDATRYELVLVPMKEVHIANYAPEDEDDGLLVVRLVSGNPVGAVVVLLNRPYKELGPICNGNHWTRTFFNWWFEQLWAELQEWRETCGE